MGFDGTSAQEATRSKKKKVKKFRCELCSVRLPFTEEIYREHMEGKQHAAMNMLLDNKIWPGPIGEENGHQTKPIIYQHDTKNGLLWCRLCSKSWKTPMDLVKHQCSIGHMKQMIRNGLFKHQVLYYCDVCDEVAGILSAVSCNDHLKSQKHQSIVGGNVRYGMSTWKSPDDWIESIMDWNINDLISVPAMIANLTPHEFDLMNKGKMESWDIPDEFLQDSREYHAEIIYWEHRFTETRMKEFRGVQVKETSAYLATKVEEAKRKKVMSHCADVIRHVFRNYPVGNKLELLIFDPASFKIFLTGRMNIEAFLILHKLLTVRLPTRQEGNDRIKYSAKDFVVKRVEPGTVLPKQVMMISAASTLPPSPSSSSSSTSIASASSSSTSTSSVVSSFSFSPIQPISTTATILQPPNKPLHLSGTPGTSSQPASSDDDLRLAEPSSSQSEPANLRLHSHKIIKKLTSKYRQRRHQRCLKFGSKRRRDGIGSYIYLKLLRTAVVYLKREKSINRIPKFRALKKQMNILDNEKTDQNPLVTPSKNLSISIATESAMAVDRQGMDAHLSTLLYTPTESDSTITPSTSASSAFQLSSSSSKSICIPPSSEDHQKAIISLESILWLGPDRINDLQEGLRTINHPFDSPQDDFTVGFTFPGSTFSRLGNENDDEDVQRSTQNGSEEEEEEEEEGVGRMSIVDCATSCQAKIEFLLSPLSIKNVVGFGHPKCLPVVQSFLHQLLNGDDATANIIILALTNHWSYNSNNNNNNSQ